MRPMGCLSKAIPRVTALEPSVHNTYLNVFSKPLRWIPATGKNVFKDDKSPVEIEIKCSRNKIILFIIYHTYSDD